MEFLKNSFNKIWEGFLQNIGVLLTAFFVSGGYLVAINKLNEFQNAVRSIPSDYFLTPLVLVLILFVVLIKINRSQQSQLSMLKQEPEKNERDARFITHLGVWWKVYFDSEYMEDFPYCTCCEPKLKIVQIEWHPDEVFKCPKTNTEYKLYDKIPRRKVEVLNSLYSSYFHGLSIQFREKYLAELKKIKELRPELSESEMSENLFKIKPFCFIPLDERKKIIEKHRHPMQAFYFVERHYNSYKKYFRKKNKD